MKRCTLHIAKLEDFKTWLAFEGIAHRPGKGDWQVLQVETPQHGWQVVFARADMPEHFTINEKLMPLVRAFIADTRSQKTPLLELSDALVDEHLDAVLRAAGSGLRYYSMEKTISEMRRAMREAMTAALKGGAQ